MKDRGRELLDYIGKHLGGVGIVAVVLVMSLTVAIGVSGQSRDFDPGEIDTSFAMEHAGQPERTGYDLAGEGEDTREINSDTQQEPEPEEEEGESPELTKTEVLPEEREQILLPNGVTDHLSPTDTVDTGVGSGGDGPGFAWEPDKEETDEPEPDKDAKPDQDPFQEGDGDKVPPEEDKEPEKPEEKEKFSIIIDGENKVFASEDEALLWVAENAGSNGGQYFEGFVKDENGNLVPSYGDKDHFDGSLDGDTSWNYTGESSTFVVPEGSSALELAGIKENDKVTTIVIPKTVTEIITSEGNSFTALEKFVVSGDNPNYLSVDGVLYRKMGNGEVKLVMMPGAKREIKEWPQNLTIVGSGAFYNSQIERVELPDTVAQLEERAFENALAATIVLPESVKAIGDMAFAYLEPQEGEAASWHKILVKAKEPPAVTNMAFYWMDDNLEHKKGEPTTEILVLDSPGNQIYEAYLMTWGRALARRYGEASLQILKTENNAQRSYKYWEEGEKKGFQRVGGETAFFYWDSLGVFYVDEKGGKTLGVCTSTGEVVNLAETGIVSVEEGAFDGCSYMTAVRLPETLSFLPENVFAKNEELRVIISYAPAPPTNRTGVRKDCVVAVKPGALGDYQAAWGDQVRKILGVSEAYSVTKSGLLLDGEGSSRLLDIPVDMESLSIPSYVTSVYDGAFAGNEALTRITVPERITSVGEGAFAGCAKLSAVTWSTSASVPDTCFAGCNQLKTFSASGKGHNLTSMGRRAFYNCRSLGTVLYYSYASGGTNYFYYYYLKELGEEAFYGCTSMTYAYIHDSVTFAGASCFADSGLSQAYWYTALPVPDACFAGCRDLRTLGWGSGLTTGLGSRAFYGCTGLVELSLPALITSLGDQAFDGREGAPLTLTFAGTTPPTFGGFESMERLTIYVPDSADTGDSVYQAYLSAWKDWLGERPQDIVKTEDGAENRIPEKLLEKEKEPGAPGSEGEGEPEAPKPEEENGPEEPGPEEENEPEAPGLEGEGEPKAPEPEEEKEPEEPSGEDITGDKPKAPRSEGEAEPKAPKLEEENASEAPGSE